ncbi:MAG: hypothetical protein M9885_14775 [Burkholderiaceae bacterium]|nr:hypothetical protein [Burkholderiaceae bacterium]
MKRIRADRNMGEQQKAVVAYTISGDGVIRTTAKSVLGSKRGKAQLQAVERIRQAKAHAEEIAARLGRADEKRGRTGAVR